MGGSLQILIFSRKKAQKTQGVIHSKFPFSRHFCASLRPKLSVSLFFGLKNEIWLAQGGRVQELNPFVAFVIQAGVWLGLMWLLVKILPQRVLWCVGWGCWLGASLIGWDMQGHLSWLNNLPVSSWTLIVSGLYLRRESGVDYPKPGVAPRWAIICGFLGFAGFGVHVVQTLYSGNNVPEAPLVRISLVLLAIADGGAMLSKKPYKRLKLPVGDSTL